MKATVLIVDDNESVQSLYRRYLVLANYEVQSATTLAAAREALTSRRFDAILLDLNLPDGSGLDFVTEIRALDSAVAIVLITGHGDVPIAVEAMRRGADNFLMKPVDMEALKLFLHKALELGTMRRGQQTRKRMVKMLVPYFGDAPASREVQALAQNAAQSDSTVVLYGETGVGKGVLARWIHENSPRAAMPFVEVNCSSLRGEILASELFGHARGAFTSAVEDRQGLIEVADGGTLFLDEIGDMDIAVQAQFLKVIEEKRYRRLGEVRMRSSEFRLVCATNHNLEQQAAEGAFRRDLFFRINVLPITIPPLRTVPENLPGLVQSLLKFLCTREVDVAPEVYPLLARCAWPGNVRELRNVLERALVHGPTRLTPEHFPLLATDAPPVAATMAAPSPVKLADLEMSRIKDAMARFGGDTNKVSEALGISRATLYRRLAALKQSAG
ncbi:MAG TPA: sigma-54 dependent transcriptional regulator [Kiritimatiellia bacterium]|nr:sigma-54 dependent transcriptional regulator [Kiritimatiellia bacterium]